MLVWLKFAQGLASVFVLTFYMLCSQCEEKPGEASKKETFLPVLSYRAYSAFSLESNLFTSYDEN